MSTWLWVLIIVVGCARWAWTHRPRRQAVGLVHQERRP